MAKKSAGAGFRLKKLQLVDGDAVHEDRDGDNIGIANGLKLTHFLNELFYANFDDQLTDEELEAALTAEFPNRKSNQGIPAYRSYFNQNVHGFGTGEKLDGEYRLTKFKVEEAKPAEKKTSAKKTSKKATSKK